MYGWKQCKKKMTKMDNSLVGYIALLSARLLCKGWVGDHFCDCSICIMAYMDSRGWDEPTPPIYIYMSIIIYIVFTIYTLLDLAPPKQNFWLRQCSQGGQTAQHLIFLILQKKSWISLLWRLASWIFPNRYTLWRWKRLKTWKLVLEQ